MKTPPEIETRLELVKKWLYNLKNKILNQEILLVCLTKNIDDKVIKQLETDIEEKLSLKNKALKRYEILELRDWLKDDSIQKDNEKKNIILLTNYHISITSIKKLNRKVLSINFPFESRYDDIIELFTYVEKSDKDTSSNEFLPFYLEVKDPLEILQLDGNIIMQFLSGTTAIKDSEIFYFLKNTNLIAPREDLLNMTEKPYKSLSINDSLQEEYIIRDIVILKERGILTSRLSIAIYRKALFDKNASITEVGRFFNKKFNQSKVVSLKKLCNGTSVNYNGLSKVKVKAYDLNSKVKSEKEIRKELELEIKEHIAKKLLFFTDIDIDTIQRIVELPKSTLKSYR